jgi:uncharacterized protein YjbI with pentapeptide repeats
MEFKFVGKFTLLIGAHYLAGDQYDHRYIIQLPLCLKKQSDGTEGAVVSARYYGVPAHKQFTVWETPMAQPIANQSTIILRAANGLYVTRHADDTLAADATDPNDALLFKRYLQENPDSAEEPLVGPLLHDARNFWSQIILVNVAPAVFDAKMGDPLNAPWVPANGLDPNPNLPGHSPHPPLRPVSFGVKFYDHTPVYEQTQRYPWPGPWDFSWVHFPGPWGWPDGNRNNGGFQLPTNCSNCNLRGVFAPHSALENLSGANLTDADLSTSSMNEANFVGATLARTKLSDSLLCQSNFEGVDLSTSVVRGSDFRGANLKNASLAGCDLKNTAFEPLPFWGHPSIKTNLEGTDFSFTDLNNEPFRQKYREQPLTPFGSVRQFSTNPNNLTKFRNATLTFDIINLDWSCLDLTDATVKNLPQDLSGLQASHLTAHHFDFTKRILKNAVFENADLSAMEEDKLTNFREADLTGARFNGAKLTGTGFTSAKLNNARFDNATLTDAIFTDADLTGATFIGAILTGATLADAMLDGANFTGGAKLGDSDRRRAAILSYANMRGAVLSGANLVNCDLSYAQWYGPEAKGDGGITAQGASFADANLGALNLSEAKIRDANFTGAILIGANLTGADADAAKFANAHLQGVDFTGAILTGANFTSATIALEQGVPICILEQKYSADLDNGVLSNQLRSALEQKGCSLLDKPSVSVDARGAKWTITNAMQTPPPKGLGAAYATFQIIKSPRDALQVYGSGIWVTQVDDKNHLQTISVLCSPTIWDGCTFDRDTTFPNGHTYHEFKAGLYTWEELMTAKAPVQPPQCVYTPKTWGCHPVRR